MCHACFMRFALIVGIVVLIAITALVLLQRSLIYFPTQHVPDVHVLHPTAEEISFSTADELTLSGWFVPAPDSDQRITMLIFNGNGGNRGDRTNLARSFSERGYAILLFDYRGYGGNPGRPTEAGLQADGVAAIEYLVGRDDVDAERIVLFGESLGAAVAIATAQTHPPAVLVLRSPFTSLPDVASVHYPILPMSLLLWDEYPNLETIGRIRVPTMVIAGTADGTVPFEQSLAIHGAANDPKEMLTVEGADHNDAQLSSGPAVVDAVVAFINELGLP